MDEREFHVQIKRYFTKGTAAQETKEKLDKYKSESTRSIRTFFQWFQSDHMGTSDNEFSEQFIETITSEIINKIHDLVKRDRRVTMGEIATAVVIQSERVHNILHKKLRVLIDDEKGIA